MTDLLIIETKRLNLRALTAEALEAWAESDGHALRAETGAEFSGAVPRVPPLFDEDLADFRDRMREDSDELGWWAWLVIRKEDNRAVGVCGLGGRPTDGVVTLGYSVYPEMQGRGIATEAARGLLQWLWEQDSVQVIRAYVPTSNLPSVAVAAKLGMAMVGHEVSEDLKEVAVYEARRA